MPDAESRLSQEQEVAKQLTTPDTVQKFAVFVGEVTQAVNSGDHATMSNLDVPLTTAVGMAGMLAESEDPKTKMLGLRLEEEIAQLILELANNGHHYEDLQ